ncbi:glycerol-3-phosphate 1-O-acyltransferase PlsY [Luteolibacter ambystomatis]|uniref:Glycerol-3-phosphate acyltransferase n=1 Tax=Luteolibacter ambystomatis TaxID=2824561 RepID=A0A975J0C8_9BACT|nr:glycerol-3-phosphate 1-O-acyltransferase PlsY [Luteolibacter ambystomatis]QUE51695.1 glycerol-3-phosphate 1-O-acyltransferase PlsY [Luteolibacter ambystomatis]
MQLWLCPLIAFLFGSIPFGLLIAKAKGIDIRQHGSGNIGATNVLRVVGKKYGITCLFLDALKGLIPTLLGITLIRYVGASEAMTIKPLLSKALELPADLQWKAQLFQVFTGLCAILGHNYSPWVGFKGGKGIATSAGVLIALMPAAVVILIVVWLLLFAITRYVSVASIGAAAFLPILTIAGSAFHGKLANGTWNKPLFAFSVVIAVLAIWKHRSNIQRLMKGTENRFQPKSKRNA